MRSISDEYLTGFVEGEGCFYVGFSRRQDLALGWQIITEFHLSQNPGGKNILEAFSDKLGCGYLKPNHPGSEKDKTWVLIIKNRQDLHQKLIPFFETHRLQTTKFEDYQVFKQTLEIIALNRHLSKTGFRKIVDLVFGNKRETNKRYSKEDILRSSETIRRTPKKSEKI